MNLSEACAVMNAAEMQAFYIVAKKSCEVLALYLIEVFLLLLYFGNIEQQAPHFPSELQRNALIDPPDQLEGNEQREVIVRKAFKEVQCYSAQTCSAFTLDQRFHTEIGLTKHQGFS